MTCILRTPTPKSSLMHYTCTNACIQQQQKDSAIRDPTSHPSCGSPGRNNRRRCSSGRCRLLLGRTWLWSWWRSSGYVVLTLETGGNENLGRWLTLYSQGSLAAAAQAGLGPIVGNSIFAILQSAAAGGAGMGSVIAAIQAAAGVVTAGPVYTLLHCLAGNATAT